MYLLIPWSNMSYPWPWIPYSNVWPDIEKKNTTPCQKTQWNNFLSLRTNTQDMAAERKLLVIQQRKGMTSHSLFQNWNHTQRCKVHSFYPLTTSLPPSLPPSSPLLTHLHVPSTFSPHAGQVTKPSGYLGNSAPSINIQESSHEHTELNNWRPSNSPSLLQADSWVLGCIVNAQILPYSKLIRILPPLRGMKFATCHLAP